MPKGAVDMEDGSSHLFRRPALKDYMAGSRRSVLPSYTGKRFVRFLWVMFFVFILSLVYLLFPAELMNIIKMYFITIKKPTTFTLEMD